MFLVQSLHLFAGFFCQKFILTSALFLVASVIAFGFGREAGVPAMFRGVRPLLAASVLFLEILLIAFIRDAADLTSFGLQARGVDSFFAYASRCEVGLWFFVALATVSLAGAALIDLAAGPGLAAAGRLLGSHDWASAYHPLVAGLTALLVVAAVLSADPGVAASASLGLVAATQGLLAYHGVSALAILVCAVVAARLYQHFGRSRADEEPA
jgi:hypothetical protein